MAFSQGRLKERDDELSGYLGIDGVAESMQVSHTTGNPIRRRTNVLDSERRETSSTVRPRLRQKIRA
jgi:hypothetical protein